MKGSVSLTVLVEAISFADKPRAAIQPTARDISNFLADADRGRKKERQTVAKSKVVTRQSKNEVVYEASDKTDLVVHRSYVKVN